MLLVAVATEQEIEPLQQSYANQTGLKLLVTGVGPVVAAANLGSYLAGHAAMVDGVLNVGVAGAYVDSGLNLLDICLARQEIVGDFGICMHDKILDFDPGTIPPNRTIALENVLSEKIAGILRNNSIAYKAANFVTVSCCSGTRTRGDFLRKKFAAGCENMEGAGVAMVCNNFNIPCVELRCVSNTVEDRNMDTWLLDEAIGKISRVTGTLLRDYMKDS